MSGLVSRRSITSFVFLAFIIGVCLVPGHGMAQESSEDEAEAAPQSDGRSGRRKRQDPSKADETSSKTTKITVEGLILKRDKATKKELTKAGDTSPPLDPFVAFNASALKFDITAGVRATVETSVAGVPIEISGLYVSPIQGRALIKGLNDGANDTDARYVNGQFGSLFFRYSEDIYGMVIEQQTDLIGAEVNLRDAFGLRGFLVGARGFYLSEKFSASTHDRVQDFPPGTGSQIDGLSIRSDNTLVGAQVGYDRMLKITQNLGVGGSVKAGVFANYINVESTFTTLSASGSVPSRSRLLKDGADTRFSTAVELKPRVEWRVQDGITATAGGTFLWLNNVSDAVEYYPDVANTKRYNINNRGNAFFYGGSVGVTFEMEKLSASLEKESFSTSGFKDTVFVASPEEVESRVAELEASAVTRGQRRMSLSLYGQINQMLMGWNDGERKDVYVVDNATSGSRFGILAEGRISRSLKAGSNLEFRLNPGRSSDIRQDSTIGDEDEEPLQVRYSEVWIQHNLLGRVTLGLTSPATDDIIDMNLGGTAGVASADIALIGGNIFLRRRDRPFENLFNNFESTNTQTDLRQFARDLDTARRHGVRWDSDSYRGFIVSAFWGENDFWDIGLRYRGSWSDWRFRAGIGYNEDTDGEGRAGKTLIREIKGSASVLHNPTGVFLSGAFVHRTFDGTSSLVSAPALTTGTGEVVAKGGNFPDFNYYYVQGGLRRKWSPLGETSVFGEWAAGAEGLTGRGTDSDNELGFDRVTHSKVTMVGGGIVQDIDSVGMEIYAGARFFKFDTEGLERGSTSALLPRDAEAYEDLSIIYTGTRIRF